MEDSAQNNQASNVTIPDDVKQKFPQLVDWIVASHSMDDGERQYWIDVLPIMSEDQLKNLRDILGNEQKQLEEAAKTYSNSAQKEIQKAKKAFDEAAYLEKKSARLALESKQEEEEKTKESELLQEIGNL